LTKPRRIGLVCTAPGNGGLELFTLQLAKSLRALGWEVHLLLNQQSNIYALAKETLPATAIQEYKSAKNSAAIVRQWNHHLKLDLLFTSYNKDIKPLSIYKRWYHRSCKLVYQQHMKVGVKKRDIIHRLRYQMLDLWMTPLAYLREEAIEKTTVPASKIKLVPVGLELEKFSKEKLSRQEARAVLQLPEAAMIIGCLGRIDPKKGQDFLIQALATLQEDTRLVVLIMGNITAHEGDNWIEKLMQLVNEFGLNNRVYFKPYQKDVMPFYQAIDVFAMPSHGETYGLVTLEAMYCEKPVIGVNTDGTRALLEEGTYGWLHELGDVPGFAKQLYDIINNQENTQHKITAAKMNVIARYDFNDTIQLMDTYLQELLK